MYRIKLLIFSIVLVLGVLLTSSAIAGSWMTIGNIDQSRVDNTATLLQNGKILFAGETECELYDPLTNNVSMTGSLNTYYKRNHTATLLPNGKVLAAGGWSGSDYLDSVSIYDPINGTWSITGSLEYARANHTATLLWSGKVLVAGGGGAMDSAEIFDPATGLWIRTDNLINERNGTHTATLLPSGKVLVVGGNYGPLDNSAEIYDPNTREWTLTGYLENNRSNHTATLLSNGNVLVVGGGVNIAEVYDPDLETWSNTGSTTNAFGSHAAILLPSGKVLVVGDTVSEIYDPNTGQWSDAANLERSHYHPTATLLPSGKVIVSGGFGTEIEEYTYAIGSWMSAGIIGIPRFGHTSTLLPDGNVLVAGGEDTWTPAALASGIYEPESGNWSDTDSMASSRVEHTATLLPNGKVLMAGGYYVEVIDDGEDWYTVERYIEPVEIYSPGTGEFSLTGSLNIARKRHTATLLSNGKVLVAGGSLGGSTAIDSAEVFDPVTSTWSLVSNMRSKRERHTATLLFNGKVLVAGGDDGGGTINTAEIYDPATDTWMLLDYKMNIKRYRHTATILPDGRVLASGGWNESSAEIFNPKIGIWVNTSSMNVAHNDHAATLLKDGRVLVTGSTPEIYDFTTDTWTSSPDLLSNGHTATLLLDGRVLITYSDGAEILDRGLGFDPAWRPTVSMGASPVEIDNDGLLLSGSRFLGISEATGGNGPQNSPTNYPLVQLQRIDSSQTVWLLHDNTKLFSDTRFDSLPLTDFPDGHAQLTVFANGIPSVSQIVLVNLPPSVSSIVRAESNPTNASDVDFTVTYSEHVIGVDADDFSLTGSISGSTISNVSGSGNSYIVNVSGYSGAGSLGLDAVDNDTIVDYIGTPLGGTGAGNGGYAGDEVYEVDMISPFLANATVQLDGSSVDVIFTEPMGSGVTTTTNYFISGEGQGTLSANPDNVSPQSSSIYRLSWNTGEMSIDKDVTITVSNIQDSVNNLIGLPNSATDIGGGIGLAPTTTAAPTGGEFDNIQSVTLTCNDNNGSGCAAIYYSTDGTDPTTAYTGPIPVNADTQLRFYSVDHAGNQEPIQTQVYYINIFSEISLILQNDNITIGEGLTVNGLISPTPNNPNQGISIELMPPVGDSIFLSTDAVGSGVYSLSVTCDMITSAGDWAIRASWPGDASHLGAVSSQIPFTVSQAITNLTLDVVASEAIKVNSRPPIGGNLSIIPVCTDMDLSGIDLTLSALEPDGMTLHTLSAATNQYGQFLLDFDTAEAGQPFDFDVVGEWTISAEYLVTDEFSGAITNNVIIRVVPTAGYAILMQGRVQSGEGAASHDKTASFVYDKLKDRQLQDDDIQYLSPMIGGRWDGDPSRSNIQDSIVVWARDKMDPDFVHPIPERDTQGQAGDLYIILIDHGWTDPLDDEEGVFYIYPDDPLTSTELGEWVTELQANLAGTVSSDRNIVVILGFCRAGAFIEDLSNPAYENRVIVASASKDESSHRGPQDVDENGQPLRDGEYFVSEFFKSVSYGKSIKQCFEDATLLTEAFTSSGSGETNAPFYDDSIQHPLLDNNGDGVGSNELSSEDGEDGFGSEYLYIGASPPEGNDPGDVLITRVNPARFLGTSDTQVDLWAEVDDPNDLRLIWLEIKEPNYNPEDPGAGLQIEMNNFKKATTAVSGARYAWSAVGDSPDPADLFNIPGTYQVFYFAKDNDTGHVSPLIQSRIYKALDGNTPPSAFSLLTPADQASVLTTTILDWEDAIDPDGDRLTYTVLLSKDDDQFTDPIRIEGLTHSAYLVGPEDGIQDLTTYYWKIEAIDVYGATRESNTRVFDTDDTNPAFGWIMGYVTNTFNDEPVAYATVQLGVLTLSTDASGYYIGVRPPGNYDLTITAAGFDTFGPTVVAITEGGTLEKNIIMTPSLADTEPAATITSPATDVVINIGETFNFLGLVANGNVPFSYYWNFDGGATNSTQQDPSATFNVEGVYTVVFTVTDVDSDTDSDTVTVTVDATAPDNDDDGISDDLDPDDDNDGISDSTEAAGPNSGDANNDNTPDSLQSHVASFVTYTAQGYVVLVSPPGTVLSGCQAAGNPSPDNAPPNMDFDYGFFDFTISGLNPGDGTTLTITLPAGATPDTYYKYGETQLNNTDHWYEFLYDANTSTGAEINGNVITLHFVDALRGDDELAPDSMVIDLGGPGFDVPVDDGGGGGGGGGGCFIESLRYQ